MERREMLSWGLPILGLAVTVPEIIRIMGLPDPNPAFLVLAVVLTGAFVVRLLMLARRTFFG